MINLVILEGNLSRPAYMTTTQKGAKKALFTLEITTYEEGATTKYVEVECYGKNADAIENLKGGETVSVLGKLYRYKSTKNDMWVMAVAAERIDVAGSKSISGKETYKPAEKSEPAISYAVDFDDLPF